MRTLACRYNPSRLKPFEGYAHVRAYNPSSLKPFEGYAHTSLQV
jgi:hypothetical protein